MLKINLRFILFIIIILTNLTNQQEEEFPVNPLMQQCNSAGDRNRNFEDCDKYSDYKNNLICCFLTGTNADSSRYTGCISLFANIFQNKTIKYPSSGISGTLVCSKDYNSLQFIKFSLLYIILIF